MLNKGCLDPEALYRELRRATRHGVRASRLVRFSPRLIDLLVPATGDEQLTVLPERAISSEGVLRRAVDRIGGVHGEALGILLCLSPGTLGLTLEARRSQAARLLGILPDTFRRERHEGLLLWDLAWEVLSLD